MTTPLLRALPLALPLLLAAGSAAAQACAGGLPRTATLGVGMLHCVGGDCRVNARTPDGGVAHDFSTEPRVWYLDPSGPAAGHLQEGDVLTAVDGALITTREGGRRLAALRPGVAVILGVRRGGEARRVRVVPEPGCNTPALVVSASAERPPRAGGGGRPGTLVALPKPAPEPEAEYAPPVRFGMEVDCGECGWKRDGEGWRLVATEALRVKAVEAGSPAERAGILPGDELLRIAGSPFTAPGGGRLLESIRPGQRVPVDLRRGERVVRVSVTPEVTRRGP